MTVSGKCGPIEETKVMSVSLASIDRVSEQSSSLGSGPFILGFQQQGLSPLGQMCW